MDEFGVPHKLELQVLRYAQLQGFDFGSAGGALRMGMRCLPVSTLGRQKISPKQAAMLVTRLAARLTAEQQALLDRLSTQCPALLQLREYSAEFRGVIPKV